MGLLLKELREAGPPRNSTCARPGTAPPWGGAVGKRGSALARNRFPLSFLLPTGPPASSRALYAIPSLVWIGSSSLMIAIGRPTVNEVRRAGSSSLKRGSS